MHRFTNVVKHYPTYEEAIKHINRGCLQVNTRSYGCPLSIDVIADNTREIVLSIEKKHFDEDDEVCSCFTGNCTKCWRYCLSYAYSRKQYKLE